MNGKLIECRKLVSLVGRNTKCYFKDKFVFFMSMLTPLILLLLFVTFLRNVYIDSFKTAFPEGFIIDESVIFDNFLQPANAFASICLTPLLITTVSILLH